MLLYFGPEVMMPLASAAAAAAGAILMFWRRVVAGLKAAWRFVFHRDPLPAQGGSLDDGFDASKRTGGDGEGS